MFSAERLKPRGLNTDLHKLPTSYRLNVARPTLFGSFVCSQSGVAGTTRTWLSVTRSAHKQGFLIQNETSKLKGEEASDRNTAMAASPLCGNKTQD